MSETLPASRSPLLAKRERDKDDELANRAHVFEPISFGPSSNSPWKRSNALREALNQGSGCVDIATSPTRSSTGSRSNADTMTPSRTPPPPPMASAILSTQPPKKRIKLTLAEKEERRLLKDVRDQEKAAERANKEAERKVKEEEKTRKDAEKDAERMKKEAEKEERRLAKETERAEKEKERKAKDDEKQRKEQEKRRLEDEKRKKEGAQSKLNTFFKPNRASKEDTIQNPLDQSSGVPVLSASTSKSRSPNKSKAASYYDEMFRPFFIQTSVTLSPPTQFTRDDEATKILHDTIDAYLHGRQNSEGLQPFDAVRLFNVPETRLKSRGRKINSVREIISHIRGVAKKPIDLTTDSKQMTTNNSRDLLKTVPFKILSFAEDIRPPYKGTYTKRPLSSMRKLACNPLSRELPCINYDDDSEAEWEADDGEDIESEGEEEEDVVDGEEDLDEFLDDAEVEPAIVRKLLLQADLEPVCSGICWEDERGGHHAQMSGYAMEFITENTQIHLPVDPLAKHYWDTPATAGHMEPPRMPLNAMKATSASVNGPNKPLKLFGLPDTAKLVAQGSNTVPKKLICADDMLALRQAIDGSQLSKLGLIEVLNKRFSKIPKSTIKSTLETIAKRIGSKEAEKRWVLIDESST